MKNVCSISVKTFCIIFLFAIFNAEAQIENNTDTATKTYTIKGTVFENINQPLEGVNVVLKGSNEGVVSDANGQFEFSRALAIGDVLVISFIGYNSQEYVINSSESDNQNITINFDQSDISLMGAVEVEGVYKSKQNIFQKFIGLFK